MSRRCRWLNCNIIFYIILYFLCLSLCYFGRQDGWSEYIHFFAKVEHTDWGFFFQMNDLRLFKMYLRKSVCARVYARAHAENDLLQAMLSHSQFVCYLSGWYVKTVCFIVSLNCPHSQRLAIQGRRHLGFYSSSMTPNTHTREGVLLLCGSLEW